MRRPDHVWLLEQIHEQLGPLLDEHEMLFVEETDGPAMISSICGVSVHGANFEVLIGVDGSTLDRWMVRRGRQVVLWVVDGKQHILKHPYPACVGPGWRNAMVETIQRAVTDGLKLEESPDGTA